MWAPGRVNQGRSPSLSRSDPHVSAAPRSRKQTTLAVAAVAAPLAGSRAFPPAAIRYAAPPQPPAAQVHRPSPVPDRIILTPTTTPAASQEVAWRAEAGAGVGQAEVLETARGLGAVAPAPGAVTRVKA